MNLASLEPHATRVDLELKTYKCLHCGQQEMLIAPRRARRPA